MFSQIGSSQIGSSQIASPRAAASQVAEPQVATAPRCVWVTGVANARSIAWACALALAKQGVRVAVSYQPMQREREEEKLRALTAPHGMELLPLDVEDEASIAAACAALHERWGRLDGLVHGIASAQREELRGRHSQVSRAGYLHAQAVSAYSLIALARAVHPLMLAAGGGAMIALSYIGAYRATHNYNVMGSAKAALESNVRYLAMELGAEQIRVNAVSAGPVRTRSASGISDFLSLLHNAAEKNALQRNVSAEEIAEVCAFLLDPRASGITGQTVYVDGGYNIYG